MITVFTLTLSIVAQDEEGGERAKESGEGRRVVGHVGHSVKRDMNIGGREGRRWGVSFIGTRYKSIQRRVQRRLTR